MTKLIQFLTTASRRAVGMVEADSIQLLRQVQTVYDLFFYAEENKITLPEAARQLASGTYEAYNSIAQEGRLLVPLDHPDPYHTWVSGTGLTHLGSAASRDAMHQKLSSTPQQELTDTMKMFQMGLADGRMRPGQPASQPEWFYKGNGLVVVHPEQPIHSPAFAMDGGEEPELTALYIIDQQGTPNRIGYALGNEFSDHRMERINYLYLAHSKLRPCSYGPELLLEDPPRHIRGTSRIIRNGSIWWEKEFLTGEDNMSHNLDNLAHHHFKYELFRQPGDVHVHFLGTSVLSFADQIETRHGDIFEIEADCFSKALRNPLVLND